MMASKANVFGDAHIWGDIMSTSDPAQQKRLGEKVANFNDGIWNLYKVQFVLTGNYSKFTQNPDMCDQLLATGDKVRRWVGDAAYGKPSVLACFVHSTLLHRDSARSGGMGLIDTCRPLKNANKCSVSIPR